MKDYAKLINHKVTKVVYHLDYGVHGDARWPDEVKLIPSIDGCTLHFDNGDWVYEGYGTRDILDVIDLMKRGIVEITDDKIHTYHKNTGKVSISKWDTWRNKRADLTILPDNKDK